MTDSAHTTQQDHQHQTSLPVSEAVREAVESGQDIRERVREIVVNLFRGTQTSTASARAAVQGIVTFDCFRYRPEMEGRLDGRCGLHPSGRFHGRDATNTC